MHRHISLTLLQTPFILPVSYEPPMPQLVRKSVRFATIGAIAHHNRQRTWSFGRAGAIPQNRSRRLEQAISIGCISCSIERSWFPLRGWQMRHPRRPTLNWFSFSPQRACRAIRESRLWYIVCTLLRTHVVYLYGIPTIQIMDLYMCMCICMCLR